MAFGGGLEDKDDVVSEINMTPLVDVMLVLLIIFIITVPVMTHSVKLDLPRAQNQANIVQPQTVTISVLADGSTHWNSEAVDLATLQARLRVAAEQQPQPEVHIRGDRKVAYEHVAQAMAAAQKAGILKLGFITKPD
ncbi:MAG: biopolymer transporter ExbD [Burkholderiaceae bacterium]|nr:biopolymer transporter ExbD [Burkholderiaceae bacterium]